MHAKQANDHCVAHAMLAVQIGDDSRRVAGRKHAPGRTRATPEIDPRLAGDASDHSETCRERSPSIGDRARGACFGAFVLCPRMDRGAKRLRIAARIVDHAREHAQNARRTAAKRPKRSQS